MSSSRLDEVFKKIEASENGTVLDPAKEKATVILGAKSPTPKPGSSKKP